MLDKLRQFEESDSAGVKELILSVLTKEYPFDKTAYSDSDLDKIGEVYGGKRDGFFVIEEDSKIVGTAGIIAETEKEALLRRLFVDSSYRRRGYGSALIKNAVKFCKEKGYEKIYFRCTDRMVDAMRLCLKENFKEIETLQIFGFNIHKLELVIK